MTRLVIVLGLVIENIQGALKIECLSKAIYLLFHSLQLRFFFLMSVLLLYEENTYFRRYTS